MHLDPLLPRLVGICLAVLLIGLVLRRLGQPHVVGYLLTGIAIGPAALGLVSDSVLIGHMGSIGVVLLLFFVGMEVSPQRLIENWKVAVLGTFLQVLASCACVWLLGAYLDWPLPRSILLGFVISLSSTAVVLKLLQDWKLMETSVGQTSLAVLLAQDLAIIPMLIVLGALGDSEIEGADIFLQVTGGTLAAAFAVLLVKKKTVRLPLGRLIRSDHELQVFAATCIALGLAFVTGICHLSTALGAFLGGMLVGSARETAWVHRSLEPFRVVFVAVFFLSVGMLVDLEFLVANGKQVSVLVAVVLVTNTFINAGMVRLFGASWKDSLYAGALLAAIGEFSFVLASVGRQNGIISDFGYQLTLVVIATSLFVSPAWIAFLARMFGFRRGPGGGESIADTAACHVE